MGERDRCTSRTSGAPVRPADAAAQARAFAVSSFVPPGRKIRRNALTSLVSRKENVPRSASSLSLKMAFSRKTRAPCAQICSFSTSLKTAWAPARFGGTGPCFAVGETSGMLQMIFRQRKRLAFALPAPQRSSTMLRAPFRPGMSSGDGRFDPGHARVSPGPAESWLPRLSAARRDRAAVASPHGACS